MPNYDQLIFVRRKPVNGKYPISDGLEQRDIDAHEEFFIFQLTVEQYSQVLHIGYDCVNIDLLREHNPDSAFLRAELSNEVKDITKLGLGALIYLDYISPPSEEE